ncbi:MAG: c-type cytochrome [Vicinamibacterales bacterium]
MKILIRIVLALVLVVLVVAGVGLGYLFVVYPVSRPPSAIKVEATPERLARGEYLALHVTGCIGCHSEQDLTKFALPIKAGTHGKGGELFDEENGLPGKIYAKNITPAGIGAWTDGELIRAITEGVSRDGTPLFPIMPYTHFGQLAEDDVHALVAYIRTLKAIENTPPARTLNFPMNLITRIIPAPAAFKPRPAPSDKVAYGAYMVNAASCSECHTPIDDRGQPLPGREFSGGTTFRNLATRFRATSANLTPDADTGIGSWTEQQFIDKFKGFETPSGTVLTEAEQRQNTMMPWTNFAGMSREDLAAIYAYLRTVKPVTNRVTKFPDAQPGAGQ